MSILLAILIVIFVLAVMSKVKTRITALENEVSTLRSTVLEIQQLRSSGGSENTATVLQAHTDTTSIKDDNSPLPDQQGLFEHPLSADIESHTSVELITTHAQTISTQPEQKPKQHTRINQLITNMKENWLVWVGALAMLIGGGYLIQVISSQIHFSPLMRVGIALSLSILTVVAGDWFHRKEQQHPERADRAKGFTYVPAAVSATGLIGIYCTVIFAFVFYQLLTPSVSLLILALTAIVSLRMSLKQGPLMAALGLVGGYTAPFWIGGTDPNYTLLAGYICIISASATRLAESVRRAWITPSIAVPHMAWMLLLSVSLPAAELFAWFTLFIPISLYLIYAVPRLGWKLEANFQHWQTKWTHIPAVIAAVLFVIFFIVIERIHPVSNLQLVIVFSLLNSLIWLPISAKGLYSKGM